MLTKYQILETLRLQKAKLKDLGIKNIGLFGSYLSNEQNENSDIDLFVEFYPEKETYDNFIAIYDLIENLFENHKIDIVTRNGLSPYIGPYILKETLYV